MKTEVMLRLGCRSGGNATFGMLGTVGTGKDGIWPLGKGANMGFGGDGTVGSVGMETAGSGGNVSLGSVGMSGNGCNEGLGL